MQHEFLCLYLYSVTGLQSCSITAQTLSVFNAPKDLCVTQKSVIFICYLSESIACESFLCVWCWSVFFLYKTLWQEGRPQPPLTDESETVAAYLCVSSAIWKVYVPALHHWKIICRNEPVKCRSCFYTNLNLKICQMCFCTLLIRIHSSLVRLVW